MPEPQRSLVGRLALALATAAVVAMAGCSKVDTGAPSSTPVGGTVGGTGAPSAGAGPQAVSFDFSEAGCDPKELRAAAGTVTFTAHNTGTDAGEVEITAGGRIKGEAENVVPNFTKTFTTELDAGEYDVVCGSTSAPKGHLVVGGGPK